jgi:hypothetical protein
MGDHAILWRTRQQVNIRSYEKREGEKDEEIIIGGMSEIVSKLLVLEG